MNELMDPNSVGQMLSGAGTAVTAVATLALVAATVVLARETRRLARLTSWPHITASIEGNRWAVGFADLRVENTGSATAYDIRVNFNPPLPHTPIDEGDPPPLQQISVLRPGHGLSSFVASYADMIEETYEVTVSWKSGPQAKSREELVYSIRIADIRGSSQFGGGDPAVRIADELEKLQKMVKDIGRGWKKLQVDTFSSADRKRQQEKIEAELARRREDDDGTET